MVDTVSHLFDWSRTPQFFRKMGKSFDIEAMNGSANYQLVFSSYCPSSIDDCLTWDGLLNDDVTQTQVSDCSLLFQDDIIKLSADVTWTIPNDDIVPLKAVFLRSKDTKFVLGYSINNSAFEITNQLKVAKDTIFWSFSNG